MQFYSFSPFGYEGALVTVEVDLRRGIPAIDLVGLADNAVKESRERMQAAIRNSGFELPPERANQLGKQLAEEMWGDKYQVVICTHINKKNVHNHIILNSVSFVDGKKYHNGNENIAFVKQISDRLCLENGLRIILLYSFFS